MVKHRELWRGLFALDENYVLAERCCGMLGTLATGIRQRGDLLKTLPVLDMEKEILASYTSIARCSLYVQRPSSFFKDFIMSDPLLFWMGMLSEEFSDPAMHHCQRPS
jgi:hypothetical protein